MTHSDIGVSRNRRVIRHMAGGLAARSASLLLMFYSTRLMLELLGAEELGIWLVVLGVLQWVTYFDFGISFGARNELARSLARGDTETAARVVATGYLYCLYVAVVLLLVSAGLLLTPLNHWLATVVFAGRDMGAVMALCLLAFVANFVLGFVQQIYAALEKGAVTAVYGLLVNVLLVMALRGLLPGHTRIGEVAVVYCAAMILPNVAMTAWLFVRHPLLRPARGCIDHALRPAILGVGLPLFVIQLCALVIFSTDRLIVSAAVGPHAVVTYDAAFKVFGVLTMVHGVAMGVLWSSFTHAHAQGDWVWIRRVLRRLQLVMLPLALGCLTLVLLSPSLVRWWLGELAVGRTALYLGFAVFVWLSCWSNIWAYFLNGIGEVRVQMYSALVAAGLNIPLSLWFARGLGMGEAGVIWGTVVSLCFFSVIGPIETTRVIRKEALKA
ncbi:MAG TPA: lipopolysaccharide biosynthesis protein [Moraxellaceae bacterium]|nr:lipopolysaccharide biosynthesis protein [Moraxellaceae bacterium]